MNEEIIYIISIILRNLDNDKKSTIDYPIKNPPKMDMRKLTHLIHQSKELLPGMNRFSIEIPREIKTIGEFPQVNQNVAEPANIIFNHVNIFNNILNSNLPLKTIPKEASIAEITIPDEVTHIAKDAFVSCSELKSIRINDPNKEIFEMSYNSNTEQYVNGKSLIQFALDSDNYALFANTLLQHGENIKSSSLPEDLRDSLSSNSGDNIDPDKATKYILPLLCEIKDEETIDKIVHHYIKENKLGTLITFVAQQQNNNLSLLNKAIQLRTKPVYINSRLDGSLKLESIQNYLGQSDAKSLFLVSRGSKGVDFKATDHPSSSQVAFKK